VPISFIKTPEQVSSLLLTDKVTDPVGVPNKEVTVKITVTGCIIQVGFGSSVEIIVFVSAFITKTRRKAPG